MSAFPATHGSKADIQTLARLSGVTAMVEWICLTSFFGVIAYILNLTLRSVVKRSGLRALLILGTLVVLSPAWLTLWILVGSYVGDATGWFRIEDHMTMGPAAEPRR